MPRFLERELQYWREKAQDHPQPWAQNMEQRERACHIAQRKLHMLRWVRRQMRQRLTPRERTCLCLYYLHRLTYAEVGKKTRTHTTSAYRAVRRAKRKLRQAAAEDTSWRY